MRNIIMCILIFGLTISMHSLKAMEANKTLGLGKQQEELKKKKYPFYKELFASIEQVSDSMVQSKPQEVYTLLVDVYKKGAERSWCRGVKDGKLSMRLAPFEDASVDPVEEQDVCDVALWQLLLGKVAGLQMHASSDGALDKVIMLSALVATKLACAQCGRVTFSEDLEVAWESAKLYEVIARSTAISRLDFARADFQENPDKARLKTVQDLETAKADDIKNIFERRQRLAELNKKEISGKK